VQLFDLSTVALEKALSGSSLRQELIANNLANANTPGYRRVDVDFHTALGQALDRAQGTSQVEQVKFSPTEDPSGAVRLDGSNVDVDREMASLSENSLEYQALVATLRARMSMLQNVINGR
jgi:flagellar basal-body rod protein FlgB